ncbi:DUF4190 domain-containing protein [Streptomyces sp. NRRL B-24484]|uniref:DUF4190 domain-containing protein n=1 Tax=Streptomyces sp. NRRL B-24484 TaxID=1463833 RepID=UPI0004BEC987|nr:DUF4190 domain-containing protein [Streptomyces sp. NRRL B-24484]
MTAEANNGTDEASGGGTAGPAAGDDARSAALASFLRRPVEADPKARPAWSRLAVASAVVGLIGPLWPAGLVAGAVALLRLRGTERSGRALAVAGIVLSTVWAAMYLVVDGGGSDSDQVRTVSGYDLRAGDCFGLQSADAGLAREVTAVPCAGTHHGEVLGLVDLGEAVAGGTADQEAKARTDCGALVRSSVAAGRRLPATAGVDVLLPQGNTTVVRTKTQAVCAVVDPGAGWTGSLRQPSDPSDGSDG